MGSSPTTRIVVMKEIKIKFKFTDEQYEEVKAEAEDMNMTEGQMLTEVMKFLIKDMLETRKKIIHSPLQTAF